MNMSNNKADLFAEVQRLQKRVDLLEANADPFQLITEGLKIAYKNTLNWCKTEFLPLCKDIYKAGLSTKRFCWYVVEELA